METDGDPRVGAEEPHGAGSVQRHHAGLSPPAVRRGWQRWQRGQEWQDTGATVPQTPKEGLTTFPLSASPGQGSWGCQGQAPTLLTLQGQGHGAS